MYAASLTRRALLGSALASSVLGWARAGRAEDADAHVARMDRIAEVIAEYDQQGEHRTATRVDEKSAGWLVRALADCGLAARLERFEVARFDPYKADVAFGGQRRHGLPAFDGGVTPPEGVRGRLGALGSSAEIAYARLAPSPRGDLLARFERARIAGVHRAILVLPERGAAHGDLALINAERFANPDATPVVQLAGSHTFAVEEGARAGAQAHVVVLAERVPAYALNVTARIRGADAEAAPLVVMTPRSGWWACASERGGGLAAFLEIARALYDAPPRRDVVFVASSGHELGHLGLHAWLAAHPVLASAQAWLHLGANFAAARGEMMVQASSDEMAALAREAFAGVEQPLGSIVGPETPPLGEVREVASRPYLSVLGTNPFFHAPDDRWPYAVDLEKTARSCAALVEVARRLAG
ncbi:MAG: M28 family peptidase [Deltaproteobacteria bacterium]|nr:M28 family peptidase [Deltaproteobacteria bacterium]